MKKLIFLCGALIVGCGNVTCMNAEGNLRLLVPVHRPLGADGRLAGLTAETRGANEESNRRIRLCINYGAVAQALNGYNHGVLLKAAERIVAAFSSDVLKPDRLAKRMGPPLICWYANNAPRVGLDFVARVLNDVYSEVNGLNETDVAASARIVSRCCDALRVAFGHDS